MTAMSQTSQLYFTTAKSGWSWHLSSGGIGMELLGVEPSFLTVSGVFLGLIRFLFFSLFFWRRRCAILAVVGLSTWIRKE